MSTPRIALISATPLAIPPATAAIRDALPDAMVWNLLDDQLLPDAQEQGGVTETLARRMDGLIDLALEGGADGVLLTCSLYGVVAEKRGGKDVSVLSPDGPLFADVIDAKPARVLLVASLQSAGTDSSERLSRACTSAGLTVDIETLVVPDAATPLPAEELARTLLGAISTATAPYDLVVLAQYSLAPAASELRTHLDSPILDGPSAAARRFAEEQERTVS